MLYQYGASWMFSAMDSDGEEVQHTDPRHELQTYLSSSWESWRALPEITDFKWWKDHGTVYPTLSRMARDFLAIPGSSTASERQFSSARHIGTDFWNRLSLCMFEAVQVLKGGYKSGVLTANIEVLALAKELDCPVEELLCESKDRVPAS